MLLFRQVLKGGSLGAESARRTAPVTLAPHGGIFWLKWTGNCASSTLLADFGTIALSLEMVMRRISRTGWGGTDYWTDREADSPGWFYIRWTATVFDLRCGEDRRPSTSSSRIRNESSHRVNKNHRCRMHAVTVSIQIKSATLGRTFIHLIN